MASVLELFREILCKFRFTRGLFHRFFKRWVLFLAFLGRRLGTWHPWGDRGRSTFQKAECSSPGTTTRLESKKCGVASHIPAPASHPSLHNTRSTSQQPQPATASSSATPAPADPVEPPSPRDHANPSSAFESRIHSNRGSTDSGIRSPSDRLSIIQAHPHESFRTPSSQPIQFPRVPHRSSGREYSASPSGECPSRSPSPTDHFPQPRLGINITNPLHQTHVDGSRDCSTVCSHAHASLSPPSIHRHHGRQSSTSVIVGVENPSTDSLPLSSSTNRPPLTDEPYTIGSPIGQSSPITDAPDTREGSTNSPTASSPSASSNFELPAGRFLQLINSEQVPRYTKDVTVSLERTYFEIPPLTRTFP
ncbi:hypothetical protein EDB86DRAFT_2371332 [Lactarius hatsudake]|nr:hypothetical protein EDB86DRAFT_2371332 [Lactarius hatsudake]